jgi:CRP/FNR family transcriptional regulator, cyclic AMP receptor protein
VKLSATSYGVGTSSENKSAGDRFKAIFDGLKIFEKRLVGFNVAPEIARQLVSRHTNFHYAKGKVIFLSGAPADMVYCVQKGMVGLYASEEEGSRILVRIAGPGDLLGYTNFLGEGGSKQVWDAHARSYCELALISREHIARTLQTVNRELLMGLSEIVNAQWSQQMSRWVRFLGLNYKQRLQRVINELVERFGVADARGILLTPEFSHSDFAEMIACSRPMASRLISELVEEGVLTQLGKQFIVPAKRH